MSSVGTLSIDLLLESSSFMTGMKQAAERTAESAASIKETLNIVKEAYEGLAAAFAFDFIAEKVNSALEYAETIKKVAEQTGLTTTAIQAFNYAASQSGVSVEDSNKALEKFNVNLGKAQTNQSLAKMFKDLGVTSTDANVALGQFADGLAKVPTKSQQAADTVAAFGKNAAGLTELLSEGTKGLDEFKAQAEELGIVLGGDVINNSVEAEHKISALKMVISAEWASVIGQNAIAIGNLADEFIKLAAAAAAFASTKVDQSALFDLNNPDLVRLKNMVTGGDTGAQLSGDSQQLMASAQGRSMLLDRNTDSLRSLDGGGNGAKAGSKLFNQQRNSLLLQRKAILAADVPAPEVGTPPNHAPSLPGPHGQRAPKDRSAEIAAAFDKMLASLVDQTLNLKASLTTDPGLQAMYKRQSIDSEYGHTNAAGDGWIGGAKDKEVDDQLAAGKFGAKDSDLAKARAAQLKHQNDLNGELEYEVTNRKLDDDLATQSLALQTNAFDLQKEHLTAQQGLARTAAERLALGEQILDIEYREKQAALEAELAQKKRNGASADDLKLTQDKIAALPQQKSDAQAANANANMGPIQSYLNAMPKTIGEIGESLQTAAVTGLGSLTDGIAAAINGTGTLKSAFSSLATSIITDLEKVVIEESIVKPLANLLTGGSGGGGGLLGSLVKTVGGALLGGGGAFAASMSSVDSGVLSSLNASNALGEASMVSGMRANGGLTAPGTYLTGEREPELVQIGANANVTQNAALRNISSSGANAINISSTVNGVSDPAMVRRLSAQTLASAAPAIMRMSADNTIARSRARKMR